MLRNLGISLFAATPRFCSVLPYFTEVIIKPCTFQAKTIFARNTKNLKLLWIVFIHKSDGYTHYSVIVKWNLVCLIYIDSVVVVVCLIIIGGIFLIIAVR